MGRSLNYHSGGVVGSARTLAVNSQYNIIPVIYQGGGWAARTLGNAWHDLQHGFGPNNDLFGGRGFAGRTLESVRRNAPPPSNWVRLPVTEYVFLGVDKPKRDEAPRCKICNSS